jgi:hypothetical protein
VEVYLARDAEARYSVCVECPGSSMGESATWQLDQEEGPEVQVEEGAWTFVSLTIRPGGGGVGSGTFRTSGGKGGRDEVVVTVGEGSVRGTGQLPGLRWATVQAGIGGRDTTMQRTPQEVG